MSHHGRATSVPNSSRDQKRQVTTDEARYRAEAATYIAELSADLAAMARKHGLDSLGYILEMAKLEAELEAEIVNRHVNNLR